MSRSAPEYVGVHQSVLECTGVCRSIPDGVGMC